MTARSLTALVVAFAPLTVAVAAPPSPTETLADASTVLDELAAIPLKGIPPALLKDARGVAIIPRVIKAGFVVAGRGGHGVVLTKDDAGVWGEPTFVNFGGGSVGFQVGVSATDVVLVFRDKKSLDRLLEGKRKFTLGGDAAVAAGPVGRTLEGATDGKLQADIVSYSRSKGLFAGVSVEGAILNTDKGDTERVRTRPTAEETKRLDALRLRLTEMSSDAPVKVVPPASVPADPVRKP